MTKTNPSKYCRDIDAYEKGLVTAIDGLMELMNEGYVSFKPCQEIWFGLLEGLYGQELENGKQIGDIPLR